MGWSVEEENVNLNDNCLNSLSKIHCIPALPTSEDIRHYILNQLTTKASPFREVRPARSNTSSVDEYLCRLFHVMRSEIVQEFGDCVIEYSESWSTQVVTKLSRFFVYTEAVVSCQPDSANSCVTLKVQLPSHMDKSGRLLQGSLICLTDAKMETFSLASVVQRKRFHGYWKLNAKLESQDDMHDPLTSMSVYILEPEISYAYYKDALISLQEATIENSVIEQIMDLRCHADDDGQTYNNGNAIPKHSENTVKSWIEINAKELDPSQKELFSRSFSRRVTFVHGPPGSGKTYLGVKFVQFFLHSSDQPVLVLCRSSSCLDHFLENVLHLTPRLVRLGEGCGSPCLQAHTLNVIWEVITKTVRNGEQFTCLSESLGDIKLLQDRVYKVVEEIGGVGAVESLVTTKNVLHELSNVDELQRVLEAVKMCHFTREVLDRMIPSECSLRRSNDLKQAFLQWLYLTPSDVAIYESIPEFASAVDRTKCRVQKRLLLQENMEQSNECQVSTEQFDEICESIAIEMIEWANSISNPVPSDIDELPLADRWRLCLAWIKDLKRFVSDEIEATRNRFDDFLFSNIFNRASVVGTTCEDLLKNRNFIQSLCSRAVVVEEAAQVPDLSVILSLTKKTEFLVLIEDSFYVSEYPTEDIQGHADSPCIDKHTCLSSMFINNVPKECLRIQHRMDRRLCDILTYSYNFKSCPEYGHIRGMAKNVFFLNYKATESISFIKETGKILIGLCWYFIQNKYDSSQITILVNSSRLECFLIKNLNNRLGPNSVSVVTPESFRGKESDITLVSFNGNSKQDLVFTLESQQARNVMNIMLSRSRRGLYCIGDFKLFAARDETWHKFVAKLKRDDIIGDSLPLRCASHPQCVWYVCTAEDILNLKTKPSCPECISLQRQKCALIADRSSPSTKAAHCSVKSVLETPSQTTSVWCPSLAGMDGMNKKCTSSHREMKDCDRNQKMYTEPCNIKDRKQHCKDISGIYSSVPTEPNKSNLVPVNPFSDSLGYDKISSDISTNNCSQLCRPVSGELETVNKRGQHTDRREIIPMDLSTVHEKDVDEGIRVNGRGSLESLLTEGTTSTCDVSPRVNTAASDSNLCRSPCGHDVQVPTDGPCRSHRYLLLECKRECGAELECGHPCLGSCGKCRYFKIHSFCVNQCNKTLDCGHPCTGWCGAPCPPCAKNPCKYRCPHSKCRAICQKRCTPCMEPCTWTCDHYQCSRRCSEECDRPPCDQPCSKSLQCGHPCLGFCGEPCPPLCPECSPSGEMTSQSDRLVLLEDCGHAIGVQTLTEHLESRNPGHPPRCPQCGVNITWNRRFCTVVKDWFLAVSIYRETYEEHVVILRNSISCLFWKFNDMYSFPDKLDFPDEQETPCVNVLQSHSHNLKLLENVFDYYEDYSDHDLYLIEWILRWTLCHLTAASHQQLRECKEFITRLQE